MTKELKTKEELLLENLNNKLKKPSKIIMIVENVIFVNFTQKKPKV